VENTCATMLQARAEAVRGLPPLHNYFTMLSEWYLARIKLSVDTFAVYDTRIDPFVDREAKHYATEEVLGAYYEEVWDTYKLHACERAPAIPEEMLQIFETVTRDSVREPHVASAVWDWLS